MKHQTFALWFIAITVFYGFAMEEQSAVNNPDPVLTQDQKKKIIKKYAATTWKRDLEDFFVAASGPASSHDLLKLIWEHEWKNKLALMKKDGIKDYLISEIKHDYINHKRALAQCGLGTYVSCIWLSALFSTLLSLKCNNYFS